MPKARKPTTLKVISGTLNKSREVPQVDLPPLSDVPKAPDWLPNAHAVKEWDRLAPILVANKLLTQGGVSALATLCSLHGKLVQLWAAGECPAAYLLAQYRNLVNDFGLTPVAQGRVRPVGEAAPENKFANNGKFKA